jgi:anaerobic selenocysteine-containing dehydrogenase
MTRTGYATCVLCEAACGITVTHDGETVGAIRPDHEDAHSHGHICPKAVAMIDIHHDRDRVREPMRRDGGAWRKCSWDQALDESADRLAEIAASHGPDAVALYAGNPTAHDHGAMLGWLVLSATLGTRNRYSSNSVDALPRLLVGWWMYGSQALVPVPDLDRTHLLVVIGANPVVSNGGTMSSPGVRKRIEAIRARAGRVVVIDPRKTETADVADQHLFIRPGTDALFLAAITRTLVREHSLPPPPHVDPRQLSELAQLVEPFEPERVAARTQISAAETRSLARAIATAPSAAIHGRMGTCTQEFGALTTWLIDAIHIVTGNLDRPGGMMFPTPPIDFASLAALAGQNGGYARFRSRVGGLPEVGGELPVAALAQEIETEGTGRVRALVVHAGNPVLSCPDGRRIERAIVSLDHVVAVDLYRNETTQHAHVFLPSSFGLERDHYGIVDQATSLRNSAKYSPALIARPDGVRDGWEILSELALRLLQRGELPNRMLAALIEPIFRAGPRPWIDLLLRVGPYGVLWREGGLSLPKLEEEPHGIDLGALTPRLPGMLRTPGRRIVLVPPPIRADLERLNAAVDRPSEQMLKLVSRRLVTSNNSWMHNAARLMKGRDRCVLQIHPDDAAPRGVRDGARVVVRSARGRIVVPVEVTPKMMRGVVSLPHGYGHDREGAQLGVASTSPGASVNDLTDAGSIDRLSGTSSLVIEVEVAPLGAAGEAA